KEGFKTKSGVVDPARQAEKGVSSLSRIVAGIASVRRWWGQKRSTRGRERHAGECQCDENLPNYCFLGLSQWIRCKLSLYATVEQCTEIEKFSGLIRRRSVRFHQEE